MNVKRVETRWWRAVLLLAGGLFPAGCRHGVLLPPPPTEPCPALKTYTACPDAGLSDPLVPREFFFWERDVFKISPDGSRVLRQAMRGMTKRLLLRDLATNSERLLLEMESPLFDAHWSREGSRVLVFYEVAGSREYRIDLLDPQDGGRKTIFRTRCGAPRMVALGQDELVVSSLSCEGQGRMLALRIHLQDGTERRIEPPGRRRILQWFADQKLHLRAVLVAGREGGLGLLVRDSEEAPWRPLARWEKTDYVKIFSFSPDGKALLVADNRRTEMQRLYWLDTRDGSEREIFSQPEEEITLVYSVEGRPVAVLTTSEFFHLQVLDPEYAADFDFLRQRLGTDNFDPQGLGFSRWLIYSSTFSRPSRVLVYDRGKKEIFPLQEPPSELSQLPPVRPARVVARDGMALPSYLLLPRGAGPFPLVLYVHGGPESRFYDRFDPWAQFLANRGYAVLMLNFAGSFGLGKQLYLEGRDARVGGRTAADMEDAIRWAETMKEIDTSRVAAFGFSYGGYSALIGAATHPERYLAAVDAFGPSELVRINRLYVPADDSLKEHRKKIFDRQADRRQAESQSPVNLVERIRAPLLVVHSRFDRNVPEEHSHELVAALRRAGRCVHYVYYPDEFHGFSRRENAVDFAARLENFLARYLCGRAQTENPPPASSAEIR